MSSAETILPADASPTQFRKHFALSVETIFKQATDIEECASSHGTSEGVHPVETPSSFDRSLQRAQELASVQASKDPCDRSFPPPSQPFVLELFAGQAVSLQPLNYVASRILLG